VDVFVLQEKCYGALYTDEGKAKSARMEMAPRKIERENPFPKFEL
jgi:hypothetical protein